MNKKLNYIIIGFVAVVVLGVSFDLTVWSMHKDDIVFVESGKINEKRIKDNVCQVIVFIDGGRVHGRAAYPVDISRTKYDQFKVGMETRIIYAQDPSGQVINTNLYENN